MPAITKDPIREIIEDFAQEIRQRALKAGPPSQTVINFRSEVSERKQRPVYNVPLCLLRYRKDNGRIASDVADFERNCRPLNETDQEDQERLAKFLFDKDPEKTSILRKTLLQEGQREPAIITCDGFLINGNRPLLSKTIRESTIGYRRS